MTIGWKLEGDRDRFLAALDPTPNPKKVRPEFLCPFCRQVFGRRETLNSHIQSHAIKRPFLLIHGVEPGTEDTIRAHIDHDAIELFDCSTLSAGLNGAPLQDIQPSALSKLLTKIERATARLKLVNTGDGYSEPVVHEYNLKIFAPNNSALMNIEELFLKEIVTDGLNLASLRTFYDKTREGAAAEYAEALADYVRAVLIKDGDISTGVSARVGHYREVQTRALQTLQEFERPLPKILCGLIRFGLNDFSRWQDVTGFGRLDRAYQMLGPLSLTKATTRATERSDATRAKALIFMCPVDVGTDTVTRLAEQAAELSRWGLAAEEQFSVVADKASFDPLDSAKIRALWALSATRLEALASAQKALQLLDGDPTFGGWAANNLASIKS
jgi:hypothetical protein